MKRKLFIFRFMLCRSSVIRAKCLKRAGNEFWEDRMYFSTYMLKWMFINVMIRFNRLLCRYWDVKAVKKFHTRWYFHRTINLNQPQKLNEKILWIEYNTDSAQRSRLTDKYEVRKYVADKGYENTLIPVYGIYNRFEEIEFEKFPERFVLKATHGCNMNYICRKKSDFNLKKMHRRIGFWMKTNMAYVSLEMHYLSIRPRIMCEQFLDSGQENITDYKFHCSDGIPRFVLVCSYGNGKRYRDVFDLKWNHLDVVIGARQNPDRPKKPDHFQEMYEMAGRLSEEIPFVRIDLYTVDDKIYFGEMTFTPATGVLFHFTDDFLLEQGKYCTIR